MRMASLQMPAHAVKRGGKYRKFNPAVCFKFGYLHISQADFLSLCRYLNGGVRIMCRGIWFSRTIITRELAVSMLCGALLASPRFNMVIMRIVIVRRQTVFGSARVLLHWVALVPVYRLFAQGHSWFRWLAAPVGGIWVRYGKPIAG
jgi:hypothetical protein